MCDGTLIVDGVIQNVPCKFTFDTGADVIILCSRLYDVLQRGKLKDVADSETLGLDGQKISVVGTITVQIGLSEDTSSQTVWVTHIEENCILGPDFQKRNGCVNSFRWVILSKKKVA